MAGLKFILAEDHGIVRMGISMLIKESFPDGEVTETATFTALLQKLASEAYDVLILDIHIPGGDNLQMIHNIRLRQSKIRIIIFSSYEESIYGLRFIEQGADGYLQKGSCTEELKNAIITVMSGNIYASAELQQQLLHGVSSRGKQEPTSGVESLTIREVEIMNLMIKGMSTTQIKNTLHLQLSTISTYKARIFQKMEVSNLVELMQKVKLSN